MRLIIPNNIFATLFLLSIDESERPEVLVKDSSLIVSELENDENSIALIPSLDLIDNRELYISSKLGLAFEGLLSNTYVYYLENNSEISKVFLRGDVSKNEVILSKIIFRERYNIEPEFSLDINQSIDEDKNYLVIGSQNWNNNFYKMGISFSEQISDILEFPYVNFLFASKNENLLKDFNKQFANVTKSIINSLEPNLQKIDLSDEVNNFILKEIPFVYFDFTEAESEGLKELLQLAYYHQIFDDIFNIKFV
jgi:hypothetical protein